VKVDVVAEASTRDLRRAVLRPNVAPDAPLPGDAVPGGVHFGALDDDGTVVGTCFVYPDPCPWLPARTEAWHLRQMATAEGYRGRGVGSAVLDAALAYLATQGAELVWCNARQGAVPFYQRHGFGTHGAVFVPPDHPIPHVRMWRELSVDPTASTV
jgi:GNAT superfamily N-acetyltransferase